MMTLTLSTSQDILRASDERVIYARPSIGTRALHVGRKSLIILRCGGSRLQTISWATKAVPTPAGPSAESDRVMTYM